MEDSKIQLGGVYCNSLTSYSRYVTREVAIGDIKMGADNPIRIQSMTTTDTIASNLLSSLSVFFS